MLMDLFGAYLLKMEIVKCKICGIEFKSKKNQKRKTCSMKCRGELLKLEQSGENHPLYKNGKALKQEYKCLKCGNIFVSDKGYNGREPKYCSKECYSKSLIKPREIKTCQYCKKEFQSKYTSGLKKYCSLICASKSRGDKMRGVKNGRCGELAGGWKGGVTKEHDLIRRGLEYKRWRTSVFERDNYTCVNCGVRGGKLQADHIKPFSIYKELRFDINNGRTLCFKCHKETDTYGGKMINYKKSNYGKF